MSYLVCTIIWVPTIISVLISAVILWGRVNRSTKENAARSKEMWEQYEATKQRSSHDK